MHSSPVQIMTIAEVLPEYRDEVLVELSELVELCRQEEGCLRFDLYCDANHPCQLNTIETWDSRESHARHLDSRLLGHGILGMIGKFKGLPTIRLLTPINELTEE